MAAFATLVCQRNCVFLCKGTKLQKAALFAIVCRFLVLPPLRPGFAKDIAFLSAKAKSSRIRHSPNSGTVRRFPVLPTPCAKTAKSCAFCDSMPVYCFCRLCDRVLPKKQRFSLQRHKSSRILQSRILGEFAGSRFGMFFRL